MLHRTASRTFLSKECRRLVGFSYNRKASDASREQNARNQVRTEDQDDTIDPDERSKFESLAREWWDQDGAFRPLHSFNPLRTSFIRTVACDHFDKDAVHSIPLRGLQVLDVGCGGGILSESLARLGANVTGVDVSEKHIHVARMHSQLDDGIFERTQYRQASVEDLAQEGKHYDLVVCSEVLEHVRNVKAFCGSLSRVIHPDGGLFISTINRTIQSYLMAIVGAEYATRLVPIGTHDWSKFITPQELSIILREEGMGLDKLSGARYNPIFNVWNMIDDSSVNYMAYYRKLA